MPEKPIENPIDKAGGAVKQVGEKGSDFLFGISDFLEQVTGNAVAAAIFGFFLLFTLSLIKGAGTSKNHLVYAKAIQVIGALGIGLYFLISLGRTIPIHAQNRAIALEKNVFDLGLTGEFGEHSPSLFNSLAAGFESYFWFAMVFLCMIVVGTILSKIKVPGSEKV